MRPCLEAGWAHVVQGRVTTLRIVEQLDIAEDARPGFIKATVLLERRPLGLQRVIKAFHRGVVPTVTLAAHTGNHTWKGSKHKVIHRLL